jgi:DNA replication factor GINS
MGFSHLMPSVRAVLMRDVDGIDLGLISIGPAKAGSVINAPTPLLEILIKRGIASLLEEDRINSEEILKRVWLENRSPSELRELPKDFYVRARLSMLGNDQKNQRVLTQQLRELVQVRLRKILMLLAINPGLADSREFLDKLTIEEEALVKSIAPLIKEFINAMVGLQ